MELETEILNIYKLPLSYDSHGQFIVDAEEKKVGDVRGWGVLQYKNNPEQLQDTLGEMLVKAFNEKYGTKVKIESVTTEPPDWVKDGENLGSGIVTDGLFETFTFNKEPNSNWYIVLPDWKGSKDDLQMVMGADTMLDRFAEGEDTVKLLIADKDFENSYHLKLERKTPEYDGGGYYHLFDPQEQFIMEVWLCKVTNFVFGGELPMNIHIAPVRI